MKAQIAKAWRRRSLPDSRPVIVVVNSLAAEGTPRMALELCRTWLRFGERPILVVNQSTPDDLAPDFDALGIERVLLNVDDRGYGRYLILALRLFLLVRKHRAKGLLAMPLGWHAFMALGARIAGIQRVVAHVGNYPNTGTGIAFRKFRFLVQLGRPLTDKLVCCSQYVKEGTMEHFGVPEAETAVIPNGIPIEDFATRAKEARSRRTSESPFTIGMVARLEFHKDQPTLIRAARLLRDRGTLAQIWLIGEGSRRKELESLIEIEDVAESVRLFGMCRDVPSLIGQMDLFVFATTPDEGFGIALVEAMAAGLPIVASDVGACREVLGNGKLGKLVPAGDPIALANAIEEFRADPAAGNARAQNAYQKAFRDFTVEKMARRYAGLLGLSYVLPV